MLKLKLRLFDTTTESFDYIDLSDITDTVEVLNEYTYFFSPDYFNTTKYIQMCTGKLDKNNVEIYEGDIIKVIYNDSTREVGYIKYLEDSMRFAFVNKDNEKYGIIGENDLEVISNICIDKNIFILT